MNIALVAHDAKKELIKQQEQEKQKMEQKCAELTNVQHEQFEEYKNLLLEWNEKINLTAITDFDEVVKLDVEYIDNWNLLLDIKILFKTIAVVFKHEDSY